MTTVKDPHHTGGTRETVTAVGAPAASAVATQMASEIMHQAAQSPPPQPQTHAHAHVANGVTKTTHSSTSSLTTTTTTHTTAVPATSASTAARLVGDDHTKEKLLKLAPVGKTATMLVTGVEQKHGKPKVEVKGSRRFFQLF